MNLEDLEAIRMLTHRYSHHLDRGRLDELLSLWTEDAVFDETRVGLGVHRGRAAIRDFFERDLQLIDQQVHYATNFVLDALEDDNARGSCYFLAQAVTKDGGSVYATGYYDDAYRRVHGRWLFSRRTVVPFLPPELKAFAQHF